MYGLTRGLTLLVAAAIAGGLIWLAGWMGPGETDSAYWGSNSEYWVAMGVLAGAGLLLALSQVAGGWTKWGRPVVSASVFLFAFLPALVAGGWIAVAAQPGGGSLRNTARDWLDAIGLQDPVLQFMAPLVPAIALGIGLIFGMIFDTTGQPRRAGAYAEDRDADEPTTAERVGADREYADRDHADRDSAERPAREPVAVGSRERDDGRAAPAAPPSEDSSESPRRRSLFRR